MMGRVHAAEASSSWAVHYEQRQSVLLLPAGARASRENRGELPQLLLCPLLSEAGPLTQY